VLVSALDGLEVSLANDLSTLLVVRRDSSPSARVLHIAIASRGEGRDRGHSTQDVVVPTGATEDAARAFAEGVRRAFPRLARLAGDHDFPDDVVPLEWLLTPSLSPDESSARCSNRAHANTCLPAERLRDEALTE
jgi:hypothetical protein